MGCGSAGAAVTPIQLGGGKMTRSWQINSATPEGGPRSAKVTLDLSECEEEGTMELGALERPFMIHCKSIKNSPLDCLMKGLNPRRSEPRNCKDALFVVKKENSPDFAVCVLDGNGKCD